eukprot:scaffold1894_cov368-Prasinococcus_capsulatus_cf.AAC.4
MMPPDAFWKRSGRTPRGLRPPNFCTGGDGRAELANSVLQLRHNRTAALSRRGRLQRDAHLAEAVHAPASLDVHLPGDGRRAYVVPVGVVRC